jgi:histidine decarboxylase
MQTQLATEDRICLDELYDRLQTHMETYVGYPCNADFDYSELFPFLKCPINNLGDPYVPSNLQVNTHEFEREVVETLCKLTSAAVDSTWGYVTNGGTEGNMYGLFLARELHPDGLVYYSEDTHYSVSKILRLLKVRSIMIKSAPDGGIDLDDLRETIKVHRDVPPIIFANIGSTMKGAVDDLESIHVMLRDLAIPRFYIHADAALSGMILPFVEQPQPWSFADGIDSISISGHKMIGSPIPCGVVLAKRKNVERIARSIEYVGTLDTTIMGSRNGITPLILWYAFRMLGLDAFRHRIQHCFDVADYAIRCLNGIGLKAWRHKNSVTVVFLRPSPHIVRRWHLAAQGDIAHVITMPHVTRDHIDELVAEVSAETADKSQESVPV